MGEYALVILADLLGIFYRDFDQSVVLLASLTQKAMTDGVAAKLEPEKTHYTDRSLIALTLCKPGSSEYHS